jgi:glycosyltransferase involved in cell wall biosynthesis
MGETTHYKGFPVIKAACDQLGFDLFVAPRGEDQIDYDQMPKQFYQQIDCLVVGSINEGMNTGPFEAMAMNVPVLTTDVGEARELDCIKIERSIESIKAALLKLFGRSQVWPKYSWANVCKQWESVFDSI